MHFSQCLPLATLLILSLTTATQVPGKTNSNAIAVRRNIAFGPAAGPIHAQHQKRDQGVRFDSTGLVSDDDSAITGLVNDDPENLKKAKRQDPQSDSSPSPGDSQPADGADADQGSGVSDKVRRRPLDPSSCSDGSEKARRNESCNEGPEKAQRDDADDDRYGFGPGSDGWKLVRRDDSDDGIADTNSGDPKITGGYSVAPDVGYKGKKA